LTFDLVRLAGFELATRCSEGRIGQRVTWRCCCWPVSGWTASRR